MALARSQFSIIGILFDQTNRRSLIREGFVDQELVAIYGSGWKTELNQRTGRRMFEAALVDYEQVETFRFGRKAGFNKRTGGW